MTLHDRNVLSHGPGGEKLTVRRSVRLVPWQAMEQSLSRASLLASGTAGIPWLAEAPLLSLPPSSYNHLFPLCLSVSPYGLPLRARIIGYKATLTQGVLVTYLHQTLDPTDCGPPGSSALEFSRQEYWNGVAISCSRGSSQLRDQTQGSSVSGRFFTI